MNIQLADVLIHVDENLEDPQLSRIEDSLRTIDGIVSVHNPSSRRHLYVVEYVPDKTNSATILQTVTNQGVHAQLVGL